MSAIPPRFTLHGGTRGPRILTSSDGTPMVVAEFPRSGDPRLDSLRPVFARLCLEALQAGLDPERHVADAGPSPMELLGLALAACDEADTAFVVLNLCDGLTSQARRALGEAWVSVQEAIAVWRGPGSVYAEAARRNRAELQRRAATDAVDCYAAALASGSDAHAARTAAIAASSAELPPANAAGGK
jgi:hypothetical protein